MKQNRNILTGLILFLGLWFTSNTVLAQSKSIVSSDLKVLRNIRYGEQRPDLKQDTTSDRVLDLYVPSAKKEKLPVFVFIHGGGFSGGDKSGTKALCSKIASYGYAVVSINYYLTLKHEKVSGASCSGNMSKGLPVKGFHPKLEEAIKTASDDTQLALKWIKDKGKEYGLDTRSIAISGGSAGAMTALYTAYVSNQKTLPIKAVVNLWGGLEDSNLIKKGAAPLLTFHGDQDKLIHVDYAYDLDKKMKEKGNQVLTNICEGKGHAIYGFITAEKTDEIDAFLKKNL